MMKTFEIAVQALHLLFFLQEIPSVYSLLFLPLTIFACNPSNSEGVHQGQAVSHHEIKAILGYELVLIFTETFTL